METKPQPHENPPMAKTSGRKKHRRRVDSAFAKNLQRVLAERGLSLRAAAEIAGVGQSVISSWLSGAQPADINAVHRFARATGTSFEWLLTNHVDSQVRNVHLADLFEEQDAFTGIYRIEAKRLVRRGEDDK